MPQQQGPSIEELTIDDTLTPLQRMLKYASSDLLLHRMFVASGLPDTIASLPYEQALAYVLPVMRGLADDPEDVVRRTLADHLPDAADRLRAAGGGAAFAVIYEQIFPIILQLLADTADSVLTAAQAALTGIVERTMGEPEPIHGHACDLIVQLASHRTDDERRIAALSLMGSVAPFVGRDRTLRHFVPELCGLSVDVMYRVRKACAMNIGLIAATAGPEAVVKELLPCYTRLCQDEIWSVRKACAESLPQVASTLPCDLRCTRIPALFESFVHDRSRWVAAAANQCLGRLIASFAADGDRDARAEPSGPDAIAETPIDGSSDGDDEVGVDDKGDGHDARPDSTAGPDAAAAVGVAAATTSEPALTASVRCQHRRARARRAAMHQRSARALTPHFGRGEWRRWQQQRPPVPEALLSHLTALLKPDTTEASDADIAYQSAYCMPGIALALGPTFWHRVAGVYRQLTLSTVGRIRRTLSCSAHEMARVLGPSIADRDIQPAVNVFLRDIDEARAQRAGAPTAWLTPTRRRTRAQVRLGSVQHLAVFVAALPQTSRPAYLTLLPELYQPNDGDTSSWHFHRLLAEQISQLCKLFTASQAMRGIVPVLLRMLTDTTAAVREAACAAVSVVMGRVVMSRHRHLIEQLVASVQRTLTDAPQYHCRLLCVALACARIVPAAH